MKPRNTITLLIILCLYFAIRAATAEAQVERYRRKEARRKADEQRKAQEWRDFERDNYMSLSASEKMETLKTWKDAGIDPSEFGIEV